MSAIATAHMVSAQRSAPCKVRGGGHTSCASVAGPLGGADVEFDAVHAFDAAAIGAESELPTACRVLWRAAPAGAWARVCPPCEQWRGWEWGLRQHAVPDAASPHNEEECRAAPASAPDAVMTAVWRRWHAACASDHRRWRSAVPCVGYSVCAPRGKSDSWASSRGARANGGTRSRTYGGVAHAPVW